MLFILKILLRVLISQHILLLGWLKCLYLSIIVVLAVLILILLFLLRGREELLSLASLDFTVSLDEVDHGAELLEFGWILFF